MVRFRTLVVTAAVVSRPAAAALRNRCLAGIGQLVHVLFETTALPVGIGAILLNIVGADDPNLLASATCKFLVCLLGVVRLFLATGHQEKRNQKNNGRMSCDAPAVELHEVSPSFTPRANAAYSRCCTRYGLLPPPVISTTTRRVSCRFM